MAFGLIFGCLLRSPTCLPSRFWQLFLDSFLVDFWVPPLVCHHQNQKHGGGLSAQRSWILALILISLPGPPIPQQSKSTKNINLKQFDFSYCRLNTWHGENAHGKESSHLPPAGSWTARQGSSIYIANCGDLCEESSVASTGFSKGIPPHPTPPHPKTKNVPYGLWGVLTRQKWADKWCAAFCSPCRKNLSQKIAIRSLFMISVVFGR